jgi:transposase
MTRLPAGVKVHLAFGYIDMRKGINGLAMLVQGVLRQVEHGVFLWPSNVEPGGTLMLNSAQLSMLIDGVDWRAPERQWRPAVAG